MATVLHLPELIYSDEPYTPEFLADLYANRARCEWTWPGALAVRDGAASVHYHPWRTNAAHDDVLAYVVGSVRYGLVPPSDEAGARLLAEARRLVAPTALGRLWARVTGGAVGRVRAISAQDETEWCLVYWGRGTLTGVDCWRFPPIPVVAQPVLPDADPHSAATQERT